MLALVVMYANIGGRYVGPIPNIPPASAAVSRLRREPATVVLEAR